MVSKSALTDMWIHFFEIFLRPEISARKNTAFEFLHRNRKPVQNPSKNLFFENKIKFSLFMVSKSALTDMCIHCFEKFLRPEISARKNTAFGFLHRNRKTVQNPSKNLFLKKK